jgi:hypothetical protein
MTRDWFLRVGDGINFSNSKYNIWGIKSYGKELFRNMNIGDRLWFVKNKSQGKIVAVATYKSYNKRLIGPLVNITATNEELGWKGKDNEWDTEIHYTDLYDLSEFNLHAHIKGIQSILKYNCNCKIDLPIEYSYIMKYCKVKTKSI